MGRAGLEPARGDTPVDFKSTASAISPPPHSIHQAANMLGVTVTRLLYHLSAATASGIVS